MEKHKRPGMQSSSERFPESPSSAAIFPATNNGTLPGIQAEVGPNVSGNKRGSSSPVGGFAMDGGVVAGLHSILGLGQPRALVRRRRGSWMRGLVVGKFLVDFQPSREHAGCGCFVVHGYWLAAFDRPLSRWWNRLYVGCACTALGAAALQLSHRSSLGPALGLAENRIRPPRSRLAG